MIGRRRLTALCALIFIDVASAAPETEVPVEYRNRVWGLGLEGQRYEWKTASGDEVVGNAGVVQIVYGVLNRSWFAHGSLDVVLGPYARAKNDQLIVDFYGTGVSGWWGFSAQLGDLRSISDGYGFSVGASYHDVSGRSTQHNKGPRAKSNDKAQEYKLHYTSFTVTPGIFFCWLEPGRPRGNAPELLKTRFEGYLLTIGFAFPISAPYDSRYKYVKSSTGEEIDEGQSGQLRGRSVVVSLLAWLGI